MTDKYANNPFYPPQQPRSPSYEISQSCHKRGAFFKGCAVLSIIMSRFYGTPVKDYC